MTEEEVLRGVLQQINDGLGELERFLAKPESVQAAQVAFTNLALKPAELFAVVPAGIVQTLLALRIPQSFEQLRDNSPEAARPRLEQLRDKTLSLFSGVEIHPAVVRRVAEIARRSVPVQHAGSSTDFNFNTINSITWLPLWAQANGGISPMVRLAFAEEPKGQLLDTTLSTDGLSYVVAALMTVFADELERIGSPENKAMFPSDFLDELDEERIIKMRGSFGRIERAWSDLKGRKHAQDLGD